MTSSRTPPMPLEWHPAYRDKTWLYDWLLGRGPYQTDRVKIPFVKSLLAVAREGEPVPEADPMKEFVLTKNQAAAPAPYVGEPFCYVWTVAVDDLGRGIATDSEIHYLDQWRVPRVR